MRNHETRDVWPALRDAIRAQMPGAAAYRVETHATSPGFPDVVVQVPTVTPGIRGLEDRIGGRTVFVELKIGRWRTTDPRPFENPPPAREGGIQRWFPIHYVSPLRYQAGQRQVWATLSARRPAQNAWNALHRAAGGSSLVLARCAPPARDLEEKGWLWVALATGPDLSAGPQVYSASLGPIPDVRSLLEVPCPSDIGRGMVRSMTGVFSDE